MKLATYNLRKGGRQRVHWNMLLEEYGVDLLFVQESFPPDQHRPPLLYPNSRAQSVWSKVSRDGWGSGVMSTSGSIAPVNVSGFDGWVVGAEIADSNWQAGIMSPVLAFSVHAPTTARPYAKEVNSLLDAIRQIACGVDVINGGDFNLAISKCCGADQRPVSKQDMAIQARLSEEFGLINCWQEANPNQSPPQTLRWTGNHTIPYHCDGLFVPRSWLERLKSCVVMSGPEWAALSDHNPVIAEFA